MEPPILVAEAVVVEALAGANSVEPQPGSMTIARWDGDDPFDADAVSAALESYRGQPHRPERFVVEWAVYRVTAPGADALQVGSTAVRPLIPGHDVFEMRFENQLGLAHLQPLRGGKRLGPGMTVEVVAAKFATPLESVRFIDRVLTDLFARQAPLPFVPVAPTGRLVREARRPPNLLFAYHFFRRHGQDVARAVQTIAHRPLRRLSDIQEDVRLVEAADIDLDAMMSVLQRATRNNPAESRIAHRLHPDRVAQRSPIETLDIPENRFALDVARRMAQTVDAVLQQPWLMRAPAENRERLAFLGSGLSAFVRSRQFLEVGPMTRIPTESRALQRRDGYRELTRLWFALQRARQPLFDRLHHAIDVRDIATLYEYWVFFELAEQIGSALGERGILGSVGKDGLARGLTCAFGTAGTLIYNPMRKGYSGVWLRPDYLWLPSSGQAVAFDAKFRMSVRLISVDDIDGQIPAGVAYDPRDDDLVKMHAYRDALGVRAAVVLYPGTSSTFRPDSGRSHPVTVADVVLGSGLSGVGEIGMSPLAMGEVL